MKKIKFASPLFLVLHLCCVPVLTAAEGPPDGLRVNIVNTSPVVVSGEVVSTIAGEVTLNNGVDNPLPVEGLLQVWQDQIPVP